MQITLIVQICQFFVLKHIIKSYFLNRCLLSSFEFDLEYQQQYAAHSMVVIANIH